MPTHTERAARVATLVLLAAGIAIAVSYRGRLDTETLQGWVGASGTTGPLIFIATYAVATVLFVPGSILTLAGGALFGPVAGTLYSLTGATIGATAAFVLARYLAADWAARRIGGRLGQLVDGVAHEGWRFVAFVRLVPLFPFNALNYALGLTRIRLGHYVAASFLGMLPGAAAYTYLGYAGREALAGAEGLIQKGLLALGLLALVAFLPRMVAHFRRRPPLVKRPVAEGGAPQPVRRHLWRGGHDPEMVESALTVRLRLLDSFGAVIAEEAHILKRTVLLRPFIVDLRDTRLPRGAPRTFHIEFTQDAERQPAAVEAVVTYHLIDEARRKRIGYENVEPIAYDVYRRRIAISGNGG